MAQIDVTVVTHNSQKHVTRLLESLLAQDINLESISLCIVDNGSNDDTVSLIENILKTRPHFASISIERNADNPGFGVGQNMAVERGNSPFILIMHADVELPSDCLSALMAEAEKSDENVAIWEPRQIHYEHPKIYDAVTLETSWCSGTAMFCRRSAFEEVGGFDERIFMCCEDVDLSWRLRARGYTMKYVPRVTVNHFGYMPSDESEDEQTIEALHGNLCLRARFGSIREMMSGLSIYMAHFHSPDIDRGRLFANLFGFLRDYTHFRRGAWHSKLQPEFCGLDFSPMRNGADFYVMPSTQLPVHPRVSVLIPTTGRRELLQDALQSVANQTYPNIETIVIQNGDDTVSEILTNFDARFAALPNKPGMYAARNEAMKLAKGDYFVFLNEDEEIYADHIEQLVCESIRSSNRVAYSTAFEVPTRFDELSNTIEAEGEYLIKFDQPFSFILLSQRNFLPMLTVLFHRSLFEKCGGFDPALDDQEDYDLWVRYAVWNGPFAFLPKTTALYRVPMEVEKQSGKDKNLFDYRHLVHEKNGDLEIKTTVGALSEEYLEIQRKFDDTTNIDGVDLSVVGEMLKRHWILRLFFRWHYAILRIFTK